MTAPRFITFGCRLNSFESELMRRHADEAGVENTIFINTCAVTGEAVRQARQSIRRFRREEPGARIVVTGCAAQIEPGRFAGMPEVDAVMGNAEKLDPGRYTRLTMPDFGVRETERVQVNDIMSVRSTAGHLIDGFEGRARAFVQVQNGCDHRCTFCVIPYGRGNSRSVPAGETVAQVKRLVANGYREVVLTGVDLTSYGNDLPGRPALGRLVRQILDRVPALERLRLSSVDSIEVDPALFDLIAHEPRVMPHLHLSLQSGDDMILKRMKRRHSRDDAIRFCDRVREARPEIALGADLIAGFPTETDAMFENTAGLVMDCGLSFLHVFPFSARPGTPAAKMPMVPKNIVKERAARLREIGESARARYLDTLIGTQQRVLIERPGFGRTEGYADVCVEDGADPGTIAETTVMAHDGRTLKARITERRGA